MWKYILNMKKKCEGNMKLLALIKPFSNFPNFEHVYLFMTYVGEFRR